MKFLISFFAAFTIILQVSTEELRNFYPKASESHQNAKTFVEMAERSNASDVAGKAYKAAARVILSKFEKGAGRKEMISGGIKSLESLIAANPRNTELRVIRMSLQENLPGIVGYKKNLAEDKKFILEHYKSENKRTQQLIRDFSQQSKTMTPTEKATLK